jgi:sugar lactone lactonase YvrE
MTGRIQYFTDKGEFKGGWRMPDYKSGNPRRIRFLRDGNLCVADTHNHRICFFDVSGKLISSFGENGHEEGEFVLVSAVAEGPDGTIYTTEYGTTPTQRAEPIDRVQRFTRDGKFLCSWGKTGSRPAMLSRPSGIDVDNNGLVYVADALNHRVQVFNADGSRLVRVIGKYGEEAGEFNHPFDVFIGPGGNLFVIEFGGGRIQELTPEGEPVAVFGRRGPEKGEFYQPWGITVAKNGDIFAADTWNHRIQYIVSKTKWENLKNKSAERNSNDSRTGS